MSEYKTTEQAYTAGLKEGKRIAEENAREDRETSGGAGEDGLTWEKLRAMSPEEITESREAVDRFLEGQTG